MRGMCQKQSNDTGDLVTCVYYAWISCVIETRPRYVVRKDDNKYFFCCFGLIIVNIFHAPRASLQVTSNDFRAFGVFFIVEFMIACITSFILVLLRDSSIVQRDRLAVSRVKYLFDRSMEQPGVPYKVSVDWRIALISIRAISRVLLIVFASEMWWWRERRTSGWRQGQRQRRQWQRRRRRRWRGDRWVNLFVILFHD